MVPNKAFLIFSEDKLDLIPAIDECRVFCQEIERLAPGLTKYEDEKGNIVDGPAHYPFVDSLTMTNIP